MARKKKTTESTPIIPQALVVDIDGRTTIVKKSEPGKVTVCAMATQSPWRESVIGKTVEICDCQFTVQSIDGRHLELTASSEAPEE